MPRERNPQLADLLCPNCSRLLDAATASDGTKETAAEPMEGDVSVCYYCAQVLRFAVEGARLKLAKVPDAELRELVMTNAALGAVLRLVTDKIRRDRDANQRGRIRLRNR